MFSERAVNLLPLSACLPECQTPFSFLVSPFCGFHFPRLLVHWNNWAAFIATRLSVQLFNRDITITISIWSPFHGSFLCLCPVPSKVARGHHRDSSRSVQWHNSHGTLSTVGQLVWSSIYRLFFPAPLSWGSLCPACSTWHTFKMAT